MIEISGLTKSYGKLKAVDDISLSVRSGEIFSFLGVNGAGKTTTLKMLAGILEPSSGSISIGGFDVQRDRQEARRINRLYPRQTIRLFGLTGREYLYFVAELYGLRSSEVEQRIDELLSHYQLAERQDNLIENYSHGMKQRIVTCGALVTEPKVLIVDEPIVGLDPHGAKLLKESFKRYANEGMTIFLSTHSLNVAEEVSDRLAIVHRGRIINIGTMSELQSKAGLSGSGLEQVFIALTLEEEGDTASA